MPIDRRLFLLAATAAPLYAGPLTLLAPSEAKLLEAIAGQIVPADDAPGAVQAGVIFYIDKQLAGPLARFAPAYRRAIPLFQSACREQTGQDFTALPFDAQTAFLHRIESGPNPDLASFFAMLTDHTLQGFYGSPEHGGNRAEVSWKMLGIAGVMEGHKH